MAQDETTKGRVPLTATRGISVFGISVVGFMTANLVPVMIVALTREIGFSDAEAGTCRAEDQQGRIAAGYLADFAVLATNPLQAAPSRLLTNHARMTVVGGKVAFDAGAITAADAATGHGKARDGHHVRQDA
jgi:Amidohydrolase family